MLGFSVKLTRIKTFARREKVIGTAYKAYSRFLQSVFRALNEDGRSRFGPAEVQAWLRQVRDQDIPVEKVFLDAESCYRPGPSEWQEALAKTSGYQGMWKYRNLVRPEWFRAFDLEIAYAFLVIPAYIQGKDVFFAVVYPIDGQQFPELVNYLRSVAAELAGGADARAKYLISRGDELRRVIDRHAFPGGFRQGEIDPILFTSGLPGLPGGLSVIEAPSNLTQLTAQLEATFADRDNLAEVGVQIGVHDRDNRAAQLCDGVISWAYQHGASDFHLKPELDPESNQFGGRVLFQTPGGVIPSSQMSREAFLQAVTRFKVMANMDIANRLDPQDAQISLNTPDGIYVVRLSTTPALGGEWVCGRLFPQQVKHLPELGLPEENRESLERFLAMSQGMILFSGPTGSGKSTSLAASISYIRDSRAIKPLIVTVEDPIEQWIPGPNIIQRQFREKRDGSMAKIIRELMRKNPGVIMVGEIRDQDTANTAFRAVLTGHLLLSTVHANGSAAAFIRLVDLGVERFKVAYSILSVHQRLVPLVCEHCRQVLKSGDPGYNEQLQIFLEFSRCFGCKVDGDNLPDLVTARSCNRCDQSGYKGYVPMFEFLPVDPEIKQMIIAGANATEILDYARRKLGVRTIPEQAMDLIQAQVTTPQAVYHACALA